eukprot:7096479-Heterocapsa_arctica.AAC.1
MLRLAACLWQRVPRFPVGGYGSSTGGASGPVRSEGRLEFRRRVLRFPVGGYGSSTGGAPLAIGCLPRMAA